MTHIHAHDSRAGAAADPTGVMGAIRGASARTGISFDYLLRTAQRESALDPNAKARTSSATGLYQFIDQTWIGMVARHGSKYGAGDLAQSVTQSTHGRYEVADPARRQKILDLRLDPAMAAAMAGEYARESAEMLEARLGRKPASGELYAAHFLGASGAARLIEAAGKDPDARAADLFPAAARANKAIFYDKAGEARSLDAVLARLTDPMSGVREAPASQLAARPGSLGDARAVATGPGGVRSAAPGYLLSPNMIGFLAALDPLAALDEGRA